MTSRMSGPMRRREAAILRERVKLYPDIARQLSIPRQKLKLELELELELEHEAARVEVLEAEEPKLD